MKLRVIGSTKPGYTLPVKDALLFAGHEAGICYMPDDFDALLAEPEEKTMGRVRGTVGSGHHSVAGHVSYNLILEGMPKIIAMLLNNEHDFDTSEKSARYTKMSVAPDFEDVPQAVGLEKEIYEKWIIKFTEMISATYPQIKASTVDKLAKENARYFISVFTPATTMGYTVSHRQLNYLTGFCDDFVAKRPDDDYFIALLKPWVARLGDLLRSVADVEGLRDNKGREFSLFATRERRVEFGENYSTNYFGTFSQLAQAQRHRTLIYEMTIPKLKDAEFFVPPIIQDEAVRAEYLEDMEVLKANFPQGMLIHINERGTLENFVLKCHERLCGSAQLEICMQTHITLQRYIHCAIDEQDTDIYQYLVPFDDKTKCQFGYYTCNRPCPLGPKHVFDRKI